MSKVLIEPCILLVNLIENFFRNMCREIFNHASAHFAFVLASQVGISKFDLATRFSPRCLCREE